MTSLAGGEVYSPFRYQAHLVVQLEYRRSRTILDKIASNGVA